MLAVSLVGPDLGASTQVQRVVPGAGGSGLVHADRQILEQANAAHGGNFNQSATGFSGSRLFLPPAPPARAAMLAAANMTTKPGKTMADVVASQVSVRDLKTHLSQWLARAQAGEVVEVTCHRQPIARITAVKQPDSAATNPLQKAIDAGLVSWNGQKPVFPTPVNLRGEGKLISEIVIDDRG